MKSTKQYKNLITTSLCICFGSILYALSTILFIFPSGLLLGGTSGISVILESTLPFSPGTILVAINFLLIFLAFILLGKDMAVKTLVGSILTTVFVGIFEKFFTLQSPLIPNKYLSAIIGAVIIAIASGILFYVNSSSGGTDILALIVRKYSKMNIGKALLLTDILIVLIGGGFAGLTILLSSTIGLLTKTLGIDLVIPMIRRAKDRKKVHP